jgi:hypothetical protein
LERNKIARFAKVYLLLVIPIRSFGSSGDRATAALDELHGQAAQQEHPHRWLLTSSAILIPG